MHQEHLRRIGELKAALLAYCQGRGAVHYEDLSRVDQRIENMIQSLYMLLDQAKMGLENGGVEHQREDPSSRLAGRLMETAIRLGSGGKVDEEMESDFDRALDAFDMAADLMRQSARAHDLGETASIRHKRRG